MLLRNSSSVPLPQVKGSPAAAESMLPFRFTTCGMSCNDYLCTWAPPFGCELCATCMCVFSTPLFLHLLLLLRWNVKEKHIHIHAPPSSSSFFSSSCCSLLLHTAMACATVFRCDAISSSTLLFFLSLSHHHHHLFSSRPLISFVASRSYIWQHNFFVFLFFFCLLGLVTSS